MNTQSKKTLLKTVVAAA